MRILTIYMRRLERSILLPPHGHLHHLVPTLRLASGFRATGFACGTLHYASKLRPARSATIVCLASKRPPLVRAARVMDVESVRLSSDKRFTQAIAKACLWPPLPCGQARERANRPSHRPGAPTDSRIPRGPRLAAACGVSTEPALPAGCGKAGRIDASKRGVTILHTNLGGQLQ
ncbi:hypothetical protein BDY17DRAFT_88826 [Neohortaea acidophila]|uniref:Uncharacterized protein n=1 Tax=Neohortaea acidophila TaxID=245834 RepID=A0A6A6Q4K0_9PEZI|nr:uncharacterized protein BDY17DRAFT_88826 [Neohortaea acidophila]KAF2486896.1 hypothetical protein BDY17DRAFT_88826 [Neohortaea acidophila]